MKIVVGEKSGKSYQVEIPKEKDAQLVGKKIGDEFDGGLVGAAGYTLKITGGSDISGFPMRDDISGSRRASVVLSSGVGFRSHDSGQRARKTVHSHTVDLSIVQLNTVVVKAGAEPLEKLMPKAEKKEEKK
ncbi:MAG: 30S ribosomal protein S6e [Candidatus Micrarchaeia archaeon]